MRRDRQFFAEFHKRTSCKFKPMSNEKQRTGLIESHFDLDYLDQENGAQLFKNYYQIVGMFINMINNPKPWLLKKAQ